MLIKRSQPYSDRQKASRRAVPKLVFAALLILSSASLACGLLPSFSADEATPTVEEPTAEPTEAPTETPTEKPTETPTEIPAGEVTLTLVNDLDQSVCYVYISPTSDDMWNDDWLGSSEFIEVGDERDFTVDTSDTTSWDMMAADCDQNALSSQFEVDLARNTTWLLSDTVSAGPQMAGNTPLTISNDSSADICYVYISPTTSDTWGNDWLGSSDIIPAGDMYTFYVDAGDWDLMVEDCNEEQLGTVSLITVVDGEESTWSLTNSGFASVSQGVNTSDANLWVINSSNTDICWLYISLNTSDTWGDDWLGADILSPGNETMFTLPAGLYDLRAEDCNGEELATRYGANIEGEIEWELYESGQADHPNGDGVWVTLVNDTSEPVCYVWYGEPASEWIGDALGSEIIDGWGSLEVMLPPYNVVLQAEDCSGSIMMRAENFTPTNGAEWHINP